MPQVSDLRAPHGGREQVLHGGAEEDREVHGGLQRGRAAPPHEEQRRDDPGGCRQEVPGDAGSQGPTRDGQGRPQEEAQVLHREPQEHALPPAVARVPEAEERRRLHRALRQRGRRPLRDTLHHELDGEDDRVPG